MAEEQGAATVTQTAAASTKKRKLSQLRPKTRKKVKQQQQANAQLTPEERQRRQEQKKQRELALKLRVEGRSYDPKVFKKKQKQKDGANKHPKAKVKIKSSQRNKAPYHVIILPIAWHQRKEESARIVTACKKAEELLKAAGLTCRIDDGDKFSPGQKMKYWELRGVGVRLEIGPKESLAGTAVLAVAAAAPGQVANKSSVKVAEAHLPQRVRQALQQLGEQLPTAGAGAADRAQQQQQQQQANDQQAAGLLQQPAEQVETADRHKKTKHKGDKGVALHEPSLAAVAEPSTRKPQKLKDRDQLKAQLASLVHEQKATISDTDKQIKQAVDGSKQRPEQWQHPPADVPAQQQLVSGDALGEDFEWTAEDQPKQKKGGMKKRHKHVDQTQNGGADAAPPVKPKKPKVVKF